MAAVNSLLRLSSKKTLGISLLNKRFYKVVRTPAKVLREEDVNRLKNKFAVTDESILDKTGIEAVTEAPRENPSALELKNFPVFDKMGTDDSFLCRLVLDSASKKKRAKSGLMMLEGVRLIKEALHLNVKLEALFFSHLEDVINLPLPKTKFVFQKLVYKKIQSHSQLDTSPGVIGFFKIPNNIEANASEPILPLTVICDNVRTPGNMGSILRVAASAGCQRVILTPGCTDVWESKVLRSASGSHFHIPIVPSIPWKDMDKYLSNDTALFFADNNCFEESECNSETEKLKRDSVYAIAKNASIPKTENNSETMPFTPYYEVQFTALNNMALVIGGETEGISKDAVNIGLSRKGIRLNIPMSNHVESLNVGTALGIIAFEMKRQILVKGVPLEDTLVPVPML